jgi:hypothetical protein
MKEKMLAVFIYGLIAMFPVGFLASFIVSHGISIGREREARDLAAGIFAGSGFLWIGTIAGMMIYTAIRDVMKYWNEPASTPAATPDPRKVSTALGTGSRYLGGAFIGMALVSGLLAQAALGIFSLLLMYGIVVIIFRYAFGVELWNPFG